MNRAFGSDEVYIVAAMRSASGRSKGGQFRATRADDLSAALMHSVLTAVPGLPAAALDDVIWGCALQRAEQGFNVARTAALLAGIPAEVPAQTVNRLCASSATALAAAFAQIRSGLGHCYLVGGVEHMGHISMYGDAEPNPRLGQVCALASLQMGATAEGLAYRYGFSRSMLEDFAAESHGRASAARTNARAEIAPIDGLNANGLPEPASVDETIREPVDRAAMASLAPVYGAAGVITAATAAPLTDGAAALLVVSGAALARYALVPLARVVAVAQTGITPALMGLGPVAATARALQIAGLSLADMAAIELNEAFAPQILAVTHELRLASDDRRLNAWGGALALGHPLGASGARLGVTLINRLRSGGGGYGLAGLCVGMGQGAAFVLEAIQ